MCISEHLDLQVDRDMPWDAQKYPTVITSDADGEAVDKYIVLI